MAPLSTAHEEVSLRFASYITAAGWSAQIANRGFQPSKRNNILHRETRTGKQLRVNQFTVYAPSRPAVSLIYVRIFTKKKESNVTYASRPPPWRAVVCTLALHEPPRRVPSRRLGLVRELSGCQRSAQRLYARSSSLFVAPLFASPSNPRAIRATRSDSSTADLVSLCVSLSRAASLAALARWNLARSARSAASVSRRHRIVVGCDL